MSSHPIFAASHPIFAQRAVLWHDETIPPNSSVVSLAMKAVEADLGLVAEWQDHCEENYDAGDWICYATYLEVELEITLEHFNSVTLNSAMTLANRIKTLLRELEKGNSNRESTLFAGKPAPPTPAEALVHIPGHFYAKLAVSADEEIKITNWIFTPSASAAGYFGPSAIISDNEEVQNILATEDPTGPFWVAVQEKLSERGAITVEWEE